MAVSAHGGGAGHELDPVQRRGGDRLHRQRHGDAALRVLDDDRIAPAQFTDRAIDGAQRRLIERLRKVVLQFREAGGGHFFFSCCI
jgi:hypothetical protein